METRNAAGGTNRADPDDAPELTDKFFERGEVRIGDKVIRRGRPPTGNAKQLVSLRIDHDVLLGLRGLGPGWQTRANDALRTFLVRMNVLRGRRTANTVTMIPNPGDPPTWTVEVKEAGSDQVIEATIFAGRGAEARASEYAKGKCESIHTFQTGVT